MASLAEHGIQTLQRKIKIEDPLFYENGEIQNPQRLIRALEVITTGKSILWYQSGGKKQRPFQIIKIFIDLPRHELYDRINSRVDQMIKEGLDDEARFLYPNRALNALQTVGYKEFFDYYDGRITKDQAIEQIKQHTRQYAKRQLTWFKKDYGSTICRPDFEEVLKQVESQMGSN